MNAISSIFNRCDRTVGQACNSRFRTSNRCEWRIGHWHTRALYLGFLLLGGFAQHAEAQTTTQPRGDAASPSNATDYKQLVDCALDAFEAEDYARARVLFEQAQAIRPNARVLRGLGVSALRLKRFTDARRELTQSLNETKQPLTASQRENVTTLLAWMQNSLGTLQLHVRPAAAHVELDEKPVVESVLVVSPGKHRIVVNSDGFIAQQHVVELAAAQELTLNVALSPIPPEPVKKPAVSAVDAASAVAIAEPDTTSLRMTKLDPPNRDRDSSGVLDSWWFWTAVGVAIAAGVTTAVVLTSNEPPKSYAKGGFGGVLKALELTP